MKLEEVIAEIEKVSRRFPFVLEVIRLDETKHSVKYLLMLAIEHDFSAEGSKEVSLEEFLEEVQKILEQEDSSYALF